MLSSENKLIRVSLEGEALVVGTSITLEVYSAIINPSYSTNSIGPISVRTLQGNYPVDEATISNAFSIVPSLLRDITVEFSPLEQLAMSPSVNVKFTARHIISKEDTI